MSLLELAPVSLKENLITTPVARAMLPMEFVADFNLRVRQAKSRIWLQAFQIEPDHMFLPAIEACISKAKEGVDVVFQLDDYERKVTDRIPNGLINFAPNSAWRSHLRDEKRSLIDRLANTPGIRFSTINYSRDYPLSHLFGRNHKKLYMVDDMLYMGGLNLTQQNSEIHDLVLSLQDPAIVNIVAEMFYRVNNRRFSEDCEIKANDTTSLVVDIGKVGRSLIADKAIQLVDNAADSIRLMTGFPVSGSLASALNRAADRGVGVEYFTSSSSGCLSPQLIAQAISKIALRHEIKVISHSKTHAKLLIADDTAIVGSHNFHPAGVWFGTEEIALISRDPQITGSLSGFFERSKG